MLIVTYDEHGGFYDHVIPPIAEIRTKRPDRHTGRGGSVGEPARDGGGSSGTGGGRAGGGRGRGETGLATDRGVPGTVIVGPLGRGRHREAGGPIAEVLEGERGPTPTPIEGQNTLTTHYGVRVPTFVISPWVPPGKGPDVILDHCSILKTILARFLGEQKPFMSDRVHASRSFDAFLTSDEPRMNLASPDLERLEEHMHRSADPIITRAVFRREMQQGNVDYHDLTGMMARIIGPDRE